MGGGTLATLTLITYRSFPRSAVGEVWWGYLAVTGNLVYNDRVLNALLRVFRGDTIDGLRSDDNFRAKYMAGALGAVPQI